MAVYKHSMTLNMDLNMTLILVYTRNIIVIPNKVSKLVDLWKSYHLINLYLPYFDSAAGLRGDGEMSSWTI